MAVQSLKKVRSLSSACSKILEIADVRFILFVLYLGSCLKFVLLFESGIVPEICSLRKVFSSKLLCCSDVHSNIFRRRRLL